MSMSGTGRCLSEEDHAAAIVSSSLDPQMMKTVALGMLLTPIALGTIVCNEMRSFWSTAISKQPKGRTFRIQKLNDPVLEEKIHAVLEKNPQIKTCLKRCGEAVLERTDFSQGFLKTSLFLQLDSQGQMAVKACETKKDCQYAKAFEVFEREADVFSMGVEIYKIFYGMDREIEDYQSTIMGKKSCLPRSMSQFLWKKSRIEQREGLFRKSCRKNRMSTQLRDMIRSMLHPDSKSRPNKEQVRQAFAI